MLRIDKEAIEKGEIEISFLGKKNAYVSLKKNEWFSEKYRLFDLCSVNFKNLDTRFCIANAIVFFNRNYDNYLEINRVDNQNDDDPDAYVFEQSQHFKFSEIKQAITEKMKNYPDDKQVIIDKLENIFPE